MGTGRGDLVGAAAEADEPRPAPLYPDPARLRRIVARRHARRPVPAPPVPEPPVRAPATPEGADHETTRLEVAAWRRWRPSTGEDGIPALRDDRGVLALGLGLWDGVAPALREQGLGPGGGPFAWLDATPTSSWLSAVTRHGEVWELQVDVAKGGPDDLLVRIRVTNTGQAASTLHLLPTVWFARSRATVLPASARPRASLLAPTATATAAIALDDDDLGRRRLLSSDPEAVALFCQNDDQGAPPASGIADHVVLGADSVDPRAVGTKAALWSRVPVLPGATAELRLRLGRPRDPADLAEGFDAVLQARAAEADAFFATRSTPRAAHAALVASAPVGDDGPPVAVGLAGTDPARAATLLLSGSISAGSLPLRAWAVAEVAATLPPEAAVSLRRRALLAYLPVSGTAPADDTPLGALGMLSLSIENALQDSDYEDLAVGFLHRFAAACADVDESAAPLLALAGIRRLPARALHRLPRLAAAVRAVAAAGGPVAEPGSAARGPETVTFTLLSEDRLTRLLSRLLDPRESLSSSGFRQVTPRSDDRSVRPLPNLLALTGLREAGLAWGDRLTVELPTGSGRRATLADVAADVRARLLAGSATWGMAQGWPAGWPFWPDALDGDTGEGLGDGHDLAWAALVAALSG